MSIISNNTLITERSEGLFWRAFIVQFCVSKIEDQNKTLKINYSWLLITLGLVHIKYHMHIACYRLAYDIYTINTLRVMGLVHDNYNICTLHVTDDPKYS